MALYFLNIKSVSRAAGRSAPAAAAYRAGERIRDERTGLLHNYSRRRDVTHTEIFLPASPASAHPDWARQRAQLWNAAEAAEPRRNSRVAREYQVSLPPELNAAQRLELARKFSRELADRHQVAVDLAVHEPRAGGDPRNHHAHLLTTTRELGATGLGAKTGLDMQQSERLKRGLPNQMEEFVAIRERWAALVNESFLAAGLSDRVDHRSLKAQGIDREPMPTIPYFALQMERRGVRSEVAESIRERYQARVAARAAAQTSTHAADTRGLDPVALGSRVLGVEELRRRAREAWLQLRREPPAKELPAERRNLRDQSASMDEPRSEATDKDVAL